VKDRYGENKEGEEAVSLRARGSLSVNDKVDERRSHSWYPASRRSPNTCDALFARELGPRLRYHRQIRIPATHPVTKARQSSQLDTIMAPAPNMTNQNATAKVLRLCVKSLKSALARPPHVVPHRF
jgi:hypothetical protein